MIFEKAQPLYKQAYEAIKKSILTGEYESGSRLVVNKLAEDFKVSRTPLREALRVLESEGMLVQDTLGATIITLDKKDCEELFDCRLILEKEISRNAVKEISDNQIKKIGCILNEIEDLIKSKQYLEILDLNTIFHEKIVEACTNGRLTQLLKQVRSLLIIYRVNVLKKHDYIPEILSEHRKIYEGLLERDERKVLSSVEEHCINDKERMLKLFRADGSLSEE